MMPIPPEDQLLTPQRASLRLREMGVRLSARVLCQYSSAGRIGSVRTIGGHRRFRAGDVDDLGEELLRLERPAAEDGAEPQEVSADGRP